MELMFPLLSEFKGQYLLLLQYGILEKLVTCIILRTQLIIETRKNDHWWTPKKQIFAKTDSFFQSQNLIIRVFPYNLKVEQKG